APGEIARAERAQQRPGLAPDRAPVGRDGSWWLRLRRRHALVATFEQAFDVGPHRLLIAAAMAADHDRALLAGSDGERRRAVLVQRAVAPPASVLPAGGLVDAPGQTLGRAHGWPLSPRGQPDGPSVGSPPRFLTSRAIFWISRCRKA